MAKKRVVLSKFFPQGDFERENGPFLTQEHGFLLPNPYSGARISFEILTQEHGFKRFKSVLLSKSTLKREPKNAKNGFKSVLLSKDFPPISSPGVLGLKAASILPQDDAFLCQRLAQEVALFYRVVEQEIAALPALFLLRLPLKAAFPYSTTR